MSLLDINIQYRVIIGVSAMVVLFTSFLIVFISNQRKKLQYHQSLQAINEEQQKLLKEQNVLLDLRVTERTAELSQQTKAVQKALEELRLSQSQLVQKEKMASLGELTAGIAHEIQNPLNFVLNFGEINSELLAELKEQILKEKLSNDSMNDINILLGDIIDNQGKIVHHGKRAEGIVKNMLQHSRKKTGVMESTDLNELVEEYRSLGYNSFRAKHKTFNCAFQTEYDSTINRIQIIPEDIGYILVNLFNNAFYSMSEKMKNKMNGYTPMLTVSTEQLGNKVFVKIKDNGLGISAKIMDKIFQPFFTTKPTGEATGLGLSLSYDMVKAHDGELKAESKEGEYAEFTVVLSS